MSIDATNNVNHTEITEVHHQITVVYYTTSGVPTTVPDTITKITEGDKT